MDYARHRTALPSSIGTLRLLGDCRSLHLAYAPVDAINRLLLPQLSSTPLPLRVHSRQPPLLPYQAPVFSCAAHLRSAPFALYMEPFNTVLVSVCITHATVHLSAHSVRKGLGSQRQRKPDEFLNNLNRRNCHVSVPSSCCSSFGQRLCSVKKCAVLLLVLPQTHLLFKDTDLQWTRSNSCSRPH